MIPFNRPIKTAEPYGPSYSNTVIGILAVDGWAVTLVQRGGDWAQFFFSKYATKSKISNPIGALCNQRV